MAYDHEIEEQESRKDQKPFCRSLPPIAHDLWPMFDEYLRTRGLSERVAKRNVWYPAMIHGVPRCVITTTSLQSGNMFWQGRAMVSDETVAKRYESPHGVRRGDATVVVWPMNVWEDNGCYNVITEGPMDALAAAEAGAAGIGLMGLTPSGEVLDLVVKVCSRWPTLLCLDEDAGKAASTLVLKLAEKGVSCKLVRTYPKKDLADMPLADRKKLLKEALSA